MNTTWGSTPKLKLAQHAYEGGHKICLKGKKGLADGTNTAHRK
jgi:hypothetical protein